MIESYAIGVRVGIENHLSGPLGQIIAELKKADNAAKALDKSLSKVGSNSAGSINAAASAVAGLNRHLATGVERAARMAAELRSMTSAAPHVPAATTPPRPANSTALAAYTSSPDVAQGKGSRQASGIFADMARADKAAGSLDKNLMAIGSRAAGIHGVADAVAGLNRHLSAGADFAARMAAGMRDAAKSPGGGGRSSRHSGGDRGFRESRPGDKEKSYPMAAYTAKTETSRPRPVPAPYPLAAVAAAGGDGVPPWYTPPIGIPYGGGRDKRRRGGASGPAVIEGEWSRSGGDGSGAGGGVGGGGGNGVGGGGMPPGYPPSDPRLPGGRKNRHGTGSHDAMFAGAILAGAGTHAITGPLEAAGDYQREVARFKALGLGDEKNREAEKFVQGMHTYGTSLTENMALFRDAQTIFRDSDSLHHAEIVTPVLAKMRFANEALYGGEKSGAMEGKFLDMLKVIELRRGLNSPAEFQRQANMVQQVLTTSGGRVDATQYLNMLKTGGVAAKTLSNNAMYYQMEPLIQEMGGMRVGTGLMSGYSNLALGRTTTQVAKELDRIGLIADHSKVEYNKIGMIKRILPGAVKGTDTMADSPLDFLEKTLLPAFSAHGITDEKKILQEIGLIFSNRTASQLYSTMYLQRGNIHKGEEMSAKALNIDQADKLAQTMLTGQQIEAQKKWNDALNRAGTVFLPVATQALGTLSSGLTGVSKWAQENPDVFGPLVTGLGALAIAGVVAGSVLLFGGAVQMVGGALAGGAVTAGLTGVATALGGLAAAAASFSAGYKAGEWLNENVINPRMSAMTGKPETLGGWIYDKTHPLGEKQGMGMGTRKPDAPATGAQGYQPYKGKQKPNIWERIEQIGPPPPRKPKAEHIETIAPKKRLHSSVGDVHLDGKKVGKVMLSHIMDGLTKEASRPLGGTGRFDDGLQLLPPALA